MSKLFNFKSFIILLLTICFLNGHLYASTKRDIYISNDDKSSNYNYSFSPGLSNQETTSEEERLVESITIVSPNGNEFWQVGKTISITWESSDLIVNIDLEYSINNGNSWIPISTVSNADTSYEWVIPDTASSQCLVRAKSNTIEDVSDSVFEISDDTSSCNIVILGSSTSFGTGATPVENSWVKLYSSAIYQKNTRLNVINLSNPGYTTYHVLPTGTTIPGTVSVTIDENRNITKALSYNPVAIIINMPSNDTYGGYTTSAQLENYDMLYTFAANNSIDLWIATPQPRDSFNATEVQTQIEVRDGIISAYSDKSINFWDDIADVDGKIKSNLSAGDGIHVNNLGHNILFNNVLDKNIDVLTCLGGSLDVNDIVTDYTSNLKIYPNPASDYINVAFRSESSGELKVEFYTILGGKLIENRTDFKVGTNTVHLLFNQDHSFSSQLIFGTFTFKTDDNTIKKNIKLIIN